MQEAKLLVLAHVVVIVVGRVKAGGIGVHEGWLDVKVAASGHVGRYVMMATDPHDVMRQASRSRHWRTRVIFAGTCRHDGWY